MGEQALYNQIGLLQQELQLAKAIVEHLTKERNQYRSKSLMRQNKIEELQNELQKVYQKESN